MSFTPYERGLVRFAIWTGPGRDPEVAYLDARQLVIGRSELTTIGWLLDRSGTTLNTLGGTCEGPIDRAVLHRIWHAALDSTGAPSFIRDRADQSCVPLNGLCDVAQPDPRPPMPFDKRGSFRLESDFALQWVTWDDPPRAGVMRRAVYIDARHLLEAAPGTDGWPRIWPARALRPFGLELVTPRATEAADIETRITGTVAPRR